MEPVTERRQLAYATTITTNTCVATGRESYDILSIKFIEHGRQSEVVLVPVIPTKEMIEAAWAEALDEDAEGVWGAMIQAWQTSKNGNVEDGNG